MSVPRTVQIIESNLHRIESDTTEIGFEDIFNVYPDFDITAGNRKGFTVLHEAALVNNPRLIEYICNQAPTLINRAASGNITPLHTAVESGHYEASEKLIKLKADVNANLSGSTPLKIAVSNAADARPENRRIRHFALVRLLLAHGGEAKTILTPEQEELKNRANQENERDQCNLLATIPSLRKVPSVLLPLVAGYAPLALDRFAPPPPSGRLASSTS